MEIGILKNYLKIEFLKIKFKDRNFKKKYLKMEIWKLNLRKKRKKKKNFEGLFGKWIFWKLDWKEIGVSKIHLKVAFKKKKLECWDFRKIKFKNGENKKYFEKGIKKKKRLNLEFLEIWKMVGILRNYLKKLNLRIEFWKIKFKKIGILENWNFEKLF